MGYTSPLLADARVGSYKRLRDHIAEFLGASVEEIAFTLSVCDGIATIAYGLDWEEGDEIIISDKEFPSNVIPWIALGQRFGTVIKKVHLVEDTEAILSQLRDLIGPKTRLLSISHVDACEGFLLPVKEMCRIARERGVLSHLDGAQAAGRLPVNVKDIGCDFYTMLSFKWLCGPHTAGALYVRRETQPQVAISWTGSGAQSRWAWGTDEATFHNTALKYEFGTNRIPILYSAWAKSFEFFKSIDLVEARAHMLGLSEHLREQLAGIPDAKVLAPAMPEFSVGQTNIAIQSRKNHEIADELLARWNIVCRRQWSNEEYVRLPVALFNTREDIDKVVEALRKIATGT
jgi:cysteine desulfurase/selenocysteine lyase